VISFAAGQAGFTLVVLMLFNLIQPSGWEVGVVRIEDVAIGFAVSIAVGLLFWPRGAAALMRESLAAAYARSADYLAATAHRVVGDDDRVQPEQAAQAARVAADRLDDAFRQYLAERSTHRMNMESVAALVAGATRVRRTALSVLLLARKTDGSALGKECARSLDREVEALHRWYTSLGHALVDGNAPPPQHERDPRERRRLLECARQAVSGGDPAIIASALSVLWTSQYLNNLWRLEAHLAEPAAEASQPVEQPAG
jgi:uncharacterized membrane protein YccC